MLMSIRIFSDISILGYSAIFLLCIAINLQFIVEYILIYITLL